MGRIMKMDAVKNVGNVTFADIEKSTDLISIIISRHVQTPEHIYKTYFSFMGSPN